MRKFLRGLPDILGAHDLRDAAARIATAIRRKKPVILGMGAHPIKVGLGPVIVDLIERGRLAAIAMNGACLVHDFEMAWGGRTSEDVGPGLDRGVFGMARETGEFINEATIDGMRRGLGLGRAVGEAIVHARLPFRRTSILAACVRAEIPATIHVAIGTDSLASAPDLSVFAELATLRALAPSVPASTLLASATIEGARALGCDADYGTIEPGKSARLVAVDIPAGAGDVEEYLVSGVHRDQIRWIES